MTGTLEGRMALVTGGRGGAGRAICERFVAEGAHVYAADLDERGMIGDAHAAGEFLRFDLTSEDDVTAGIAAIDDAHGRLDIVVNSAGIEIEKTIETTSLDVWNRIFAINVTGTTKGAVHALTKAMACDHGPDGIRLNAICPGYIDTPMLDQSYPDGVDPADARADATHVHAMRTIGTPTDMANLVHWLASDEARYATGQLWVLDGGLSAQVQQMRF